MSVAGSDYPSENNTFTAAVPKSTHSEEAAGLCVKYSFSRQSAAETAAETSGT